MFSVGVSDHIMIAHSFKSEFFGPAQRMHGATYTIELEVRSNTLTEHHVVMDIGALRSTVRHILDSIDYMNLDEHPAFRGSPSTTERVAEYIAVQFADAISKAPVTAKPPANSSVRVLVRESPVAWATFERKL
jgi:6-pyruvoyltetrahydropterin/6-carboxytetrahydropterin synthase